MTVTAQGTRYTNPYKDFVLVKIDSRRENFYSDLRVWLEEHAKGEWRSSATYIGFELEEDATFFKLAWKG